MRDVQLRLFASQSVRKEDVAAALKAAHRFRSYGVECDVMPIDRDTLRTVRYSAFVRDVLAHPEAHLISELSEERTLERIRESISPRDSLGVGITAQRLFTREGQNKREVMGSSRFASFAFVSTAVIDSIPISRTDAPSREKQIVSLTMHEIGHLLMDRDAHCDDDGCLLRPNKKSLDRFLDQAARGLDFCSSCERALAKGVRMILDGAIARGGCVLDEF